MAVPHVARFELVLLALLAACSPAPPASTACLTRTDCPAGQECLFGRCAPTVTDTGPMADGGLANDGGAMDVGPGRVDSGSADASDIDSGAELDAGVETDAATLDASMAPDAGPLPGESCSNPITLDVVAGRAHATARLDDYRGDHDTFCGEMGARDVVYVLDVGSGIHDIDIVTGPGSVDTVLAISDRCDTFYDCDDDRSGSDHGARIVLHRFPAPRVFLMVRGYGTATLGTFTLDVVVTDVPASGSTCATTTIDLSGGGKVIAWPGTTTVPLTTSCAAMGPMLDAYRLGPQADGTISEISAYFGSTARSVAVVSDCSGAPGESWCEAATLTGSAWQVFQMDVPTAGAGDQFITIVGGAVPGAGAYSLDVSP